jgi:hypothetical protein
VARLTNTEIKKRIDLISWIGERRENKKMAVDLEFSRAALDDLDFFT